MIASGVFDRHPKLQVLIVHMGGGLASIVGRLEFNWRLNYKGIKNPPAGKPYVNTRSPFDYFKTNILVDTMGFSAIGVRAAIELCGVDRVVFGSDFGPVPYGIKEQIQSVEEVLPSVADRDWVFLEDEQPDFQPRPVRYRSHHPRYPAGGGVAEGLPIDFGAALLPGESRCIAVQSWV